ncbi:MAG: alpha/beta fold hydrolase [Thalassospira sp.]|uniref:alpha/beta fold hydrolase n=1 Tax=Thalassospira sp. TaxID=1912094 RepID=UPI003A8B8629
MTANNHDNAGHAQADGVPVVFLSGMLADQRMWDRALDAYGRLSTSDGVAIKPVFCELFDQETVADMAIKALVSAPDQFALVGMSMGGYVAFEILRRAPDRVTHLMLVNTRATSDSETVKRRRILLAKIAGRATPFQGINDAVLDDMVHPANRSDQEMITLLGDMAEQAGADTFMRQSIAVANRPDSMALLPHINMPTAVMVGEADKVISPESHHEMAAEITGASYTEVAGAAHYVPLEQPGLFAQSLADLLAR